MLYEEMAQMACLFQYQQVGKVRYSPHEYALLQPQGPGLH